MVYWNYEIEALYIVHTVSSRDWLGISRIHIDFNKYCYMIDGSKTNDNVPLLYFTPYIQQNIFLNTDISAPGFSLFCYCSISIRRMLNFKIYVVDHYMGVEPWVTNPR